MLRFFFRWGRVVTRRTQPSTSRPSAPLRIQALESRSTPSHGLDDCDEVETDYDDDSENVSSLRSDRDEETIELDDEDDDLISDVDVDDEDSDDHDSDDDSFTLQSLSDEEDDFELEDAEDAEADFDDDFDDVDEDERDDSDFEDSNSHSNQGPRDSSVSDDSDFDARDFEDEADDFEDRPLDRFPGQVSEPRGGDADRPVFDNTLPRADGPAPVDDPAPTAPIVNIVNPFPSFNPASDIAVSADGVDRITYINASISPAAPDAPNADIARNTPPVDDGSANLPNLPSRERLNLNRSGSPSAERQPEVAPITVPELPGASVPENGDQESLELLIQSPENESIIFDASVADLIADLKSVLDPSAAIPLEAILSEIREVAEVLTPSRPVLWILGTGIVLTAAELVHLRQRRANRPHLARRGMIDLHGIQV